MGSEEMPCTHLEALTTVKPATAHECEECVKMGSRWVHLRTCQTAVSRSVATPHPIVTPASTPGAAAIQ